MMMMIRINEQLDTIHSMLIYLSLITTVTVTQCYIFIIIVSAPVHSDVTVT